MCLSQIAAYDENGRHYVRKTSLPVQVGDLVQVEESCYEYGRRFAEPQKRVITRLVVVIDIYPKEEEDGFNGVGVKSIVSRISSEADTTEEYKGWMIRRYDRVCSKPFELAYWKIKDPRSTMQFATYSHYDEVKELIRAKYTEQFWESVG